MMDPIKALERCEAAAKGDADLYEMYSHQAHRSEAERALMADRSDTCRDLERRIRAIRIGVLQSGRVG
jgi:hypothetical protein